jgi:hypothetical protein
VNVYPAIVTTPDIRLDGVRVENRAGTLVVANKRGRHLYDLRDAEERTIDGGWLARGNLPNGDLLTILVETSARPCGCGGPRRSHPTDEHLELLGTWELPI